MRSQSGMSTQFQHENVQGYAAGATRPASQPTIGHALVEALITRGTDTLFGLPGIQLDPLAAQADQRRL